MTGHTGSFLFPKQLPVYSQELALHDFPAVLVENGIRVLIPVTAFASYHAGKWLGNELSEEAIELANGATATPLKLTSEEESEMQDDAGRAFLKELDIAQKR